MKGNLFKKGLAVATSFLMLAGGVSELPFAGVFEDMAITASAETEITYIDADGISQTISDYTLLTADSTSWVDGSTYAVTANTTISDRVTVSGAVKLILCDGAELTCEKGITVAEGDSLTIYGCTADTGKLNATGEYYSAGIGGKASAGGNITINGGNITAIGGYCSAGIGGSGYNHGAGNITINGGTVTATGGSSGAGIGGCLLGWGGNVTINGGKITANGGNSAAGIGVGGLQGSCDVTLGWKNADDFIYASSYDNSESGSKVNFSKPCVLDDDTPASWTNRFTNNIDGKTIYPLKLDVAIDNSITKGTVSADKTEDVLFGDTVTLTVTPDAGCTLKSLTVKDSSDNPITVTDNQFTMPDNDVSVTAEFEQLSFSYIGSSGSSISLSSTGYTLVNSSTTKFSGKMVVPADTIVNLGDKKITVENDTSLILCDGSELVIGSDSYNNNCLFGSNSTLYIYGQSGQTGKLTLKSSSNAVAVNYLYIYGGEISVNGDNGIVCNYTAYISRGKVTATAVNTAINCSKYIRVYGGEVNATATNGSGLYAGSDIIIAGGIVNATATNGNGLYSGAAMTVSGGEVNATATDGNGLYSGAAITISGGKIEAQGTAAGIKSETGNITLGWKEADDFIKASSYSGTVTFGKSMTDGTTDYPVGTLTPAQVGAIANQKLVAPAITYIDGNGTSQTVSDYLSATSNATTWSTGTYVVSEDTVINSRVTVDGAVKLVLCDGVTLNCKKGIEVTDPNGLTIYGCTEGTGTLTATGGQYSTGIGGGTSQSGGTIIIYGGKVTAIGGEYGTGIGGGWQSKGSTVKIYGGEVTATGGHAAAGIGGGYNGVAGTVIIYGGSVTVTGGGDAAGIGGGSWCTGGTVKIYGGTVTTTVDEDSACGAGIGCGEFGEAVDIIINGGTVTANGGSLAAAIGGSYGSAGARVTINGGTVTANGGYQGAGIGNGTSCGRTSNIITINGGTVTATGGSYSAGIGGGEDSEGGTIRIYGGKVEAAGGENAVGIGGGTKFDYYNPDGIPITNNCTISLRWTNADDSIYAPSYRGTVTLSDSKPFVIDTNGTRATTNNIAGQTLTPVGALNVTVTDSENGTVKVTSKAFANDKVTLTVTPNEGYAVRSVSVNGKAITPVNGVYSFTMPAENVTVSAAFIHSNTITATSISLDGTIGVNFYCFLDSNIKKAVLTGANGDTEITDFTACKVTTGSYAGQYKLTYRVYPSQLNEKVSIKLYDAEGQGDIVLYKPSGETLAADFGYSVNDYHQVAITDEMTVEQKAHYEKLNALVAALDDLGKAADNKFNGAANTIEPIAVTADDVPEGKRLQITSGELTGFNMSLILNDATAIRIYLPDTITGGITIDNQSAAIKTRQDGKRYVELANIASNDLADMHQFKAGGIEFQFSTLSYVYMILNNETSANSTLGDCCRALLKYSQMAESYFGKES